MSRARENKCLDNGSRGLQKGAFLQSSGPLHLSPDAGLPADLWPHQLIKHGHPLFLLLAPPTEPEPDKLASDRAAFAHRFHFNGEIRQRVDFFDRRKNSKAV